MKNRRKFLKNSALLGGTLLFTTSCSSYDSLVSKEKKFRKNQKLKTIKKEFVGNVLKDGEFQNLYGKSGAKGLWDVFKWKVSGNPQQKIKNNEDYKLNVIKNSAIFEEKRDYICWLGHASFLIQIDGKKILTDPCLTNPPTVERLSELPFEIEEIKPDYLLISHGHYDHLDADSIEKFDGAMALIPLNMGKSIKSMNSKIKTQEAGWFQQYDIDEEFEVFFLPSYHWHRRTAFDTDEMLWGSFVIKSRGKTIYFAGDTAYSKHFKDINSIFDSIDIALLPIGAYSPRYFMKDNHMNPQDALKAAKDLKVKKIIPMHFGTFDLSDEPLGEPQELFAKIGQEENICFLDVGEKLLLG